MNDREKIELLQEVVTELSEETRSAFNEGHRCALQWNAEREAAHWKCSATKRHRGAWVARADALCEHPEPKHDSMDED